MKYLLLRNNQQIRLLHRFSNYRTKQLFPDFKNRNFLKLETSFSLLPPSRDFTWTGFYATLSQSTPVTFLQNNLIELHQFSGLPWWMIIVLTTLGIRSLIIFPLAVHQNQVIARLAKINSGMGELATELNKEVNVARRLYKWDEKHAKKVFRYQLKLLHNDLVVKNNCHPFKTFLLVMIQIPIWVCFSVSLRNITAMSSTATQGNDITNLNLQTEGILWFSDLTCPDPIFIPLMLMFVNLSLIEIHSLRRIGKETLLQKILLNSSRIISVVVGIAATINPSSVTLYWLCSSTFGIGQSLLLMMPKAKELLRIPRTEKESATPFIDIANNFKARFKKK